jgi:GLPGLI family protein
MITRIFPIVASLVASFSVAAQQQQGTIFYERKIDVHRHMDDDQMKAMVPRFQVSQYELLYRDSVCFYTAVPKDEAPDPFDNQGAGGNRIVMRFGGPGDGGVLYRNFSSGQLLEQMTLDEDKYVINDTIQSPAWKLTTDTLTILGHFCKKATAVSPRNNSAVVAWYCEDIPVPVGPEKYGGLPGAILQLDIDKGGFVFTATRLSPSVESKNMKIPTGKKITRAEFEKKLDDKFGAPDEKGRRIIRN